jgi:magnesium-transporting ATPase (P-type)
MPCPPQEAEFFLVIDEDDKKYVVPAVYENFYTKNPTLENILQRNISKRDFQQSFYIGLEYSNRREETLILYFRHNKYLFIENTSTFIPVTFELNKFRNNEIHRKFGFKRKEGIGGDGIEYGKSSNFENGLFLSNQVSIGLKNIYEYNYLINKFGRNVIEMEYKSFTRIFLEQLIHPFFIYQIYAVVIWELDNYTYFSYVIVSCTLIIVLVNSHHIYTNYKRILNFNHSAPAFIQRDFKLDLSAKNSQNYKIDTEIRDRKDSSRRSTLELSKFTQDSEFIVPGDIIEIGNEDVIPCDCLIIDGYCTVNESDLTGESTLVLKTPLPFDSREFNYEANKKSFLFHGTKIIKCESNSENFNRRGIYAIAISTGYNTNRGNLIQNLLFPKSTNFKFYGDVTVFFFWMASVYLVFCGCLIYLFKLYDWPVSRLIRRFFDNITIIFPPAMPICMTFTSFYFHWNLSNKNISCIDDKRMSASGRTNIIVLDKTGTLTEEGLEIYGFQALKALCVSRQNTDQNLEQVVNNSPIGPKNFSNQNHIALKSHEIIDISRNMPVNDYFNPVDNFEKIKNEEKFKIVGDVSQNLFKNNVNSIYNNYESYVDQFNSNYLIDFHDIETDTNMMNRVLKSFWKKFCQDPTPFLKSNYKINPINNIIFFVECLATCHSIDKLKNETLGNTVDKKIFEKLNWVIEKVDKSCKYNENSANMQFGYELNQKDTENDENEIKYVIKPKNSYKITESFIFGTKINSKSQQIMQSPQQDKFNLSHNSPSQLFSNLKNSKYQLIIIKRFEFSSKFQSMGVIVKNCLDDSYRFYMKGAPEKLAQLCIPSTLPKNFEKKHMEHTKNGYRVLACATKILPNREDYNLEEDRGKFEENLQFLGLIIFKNKLKRDTKHVISNLKNSNCKLVMATGDNPFTSLSVARECNMIEINGKFVYLIDLEKEFNEDTERLKITSLIKEEKDSQYVNSPKLDRRSANDVRLRKSLAGTKQSLQGQSFVEMINFGASQRRDNNNFQKFSSITDRSDRRLINRAGTNNFKNTNNFNNSNFIGLSYRKNSEFRKVDYEREFTKKVREIIKNDVILCISGKAFDFLLQKFKEEAEFYEKFITLKNMNNNSKKLYASNDFKNKLFKNNFNDKFFEEYPYSGLLNLINEKGRIFFRMSPKNKVDLVNFFKEDKSSIVAMCGDGANDCGALLSADIGISIKQTKGNNVTSHFYSSEESISCIEHILKNGRACYENSVIIFKYMIVYALIQITTTMFCYVLNQFMSTIQYLFVDCFLSLISVVIASKTGPNYKLVSDSPSNSLFNFKFMISVIGQSFIQITAQVLYFIFFIKEYVDLEKNEIFEETRYDDKLPVASSVRKTE